jgi:hypothetical protein
MPGMSFQILSCLPGMRHAGKILLHLLPGMQEATTLRSTLPAEVVAFSWALFKTKFPATNALQFALRSWESALPQKVRSAIARSKWPSPGGNPLTSQVWAMLRLAQSKVFLTH